MEKKARIEIGKHETLRILRDSPYGVYLGLADTDPEQSVLLPKKQVPEGAKTGDALEVFVYRDSEDRPIATVNRPYCTVGQFAYLSVKGTSKVGAFLDWGLEKDLFVPFKEQEEKLLPGQNALVYVYTDKSGRLAATTRIYDRLSPAPKGLFSENQPFFGAVYRAQRDFGAFVAVTEKKDELRPGQAFDTLYFGLIPAQQVFRKYRVGDALSGRVVRVRSDGKLDLDARKRDFEQLSSDGEIILKKIREYGGTLPFSDNASPALIERELHMSKNGFKKALGHLYKNHQIEILTDSVRIV